MNAQRSSCVRRGRAPRSAGFTLIEMAVVIFVMALILGSILVPLSTQVEQRQTTDTLRQLEEIKEALVGFAVAQTAVRLPCPDKTVATGAGTPNDGVEDVDAGTGTCVREEGNVPWVSLGLPAVDPWGNRYRYRVSPAFAQLAPASPFGFATQGTLRVCSASTCAVGEAVTEVPPSLNAAVAVLLSHGPNGWGAISAGTNALVLPPGCATAAGCAAISNNEIANADDTIAFVSRPPSPSASAVGEFDDIVIWLSPHVLKQRLVAAGKLP
ncbi:MAG: type II secretion system protein [Betaproteobacteria bacterium]|nr:MAG: type II secretion system protein [Betaproteobacteria bacterium]